MPNSFRVPHWTSKRTRTETEKSQSWTRPDFHEIWSSETFWLSNCQENDGIACNLPSRLVSRAQDKYHDSRFFSRASRSYFSSVRLSTMPVKYMIWPPMVDLPASGNRNRTFTLTAPSITFFRYRPTWPMKTTLTCSFVLWLSTGPLATFFLAFKADFVAPSQSSPLSPLTSESPKCKFF